MGEPDDVALGSRTGRLAVRNLGEDRAVRNTHRSRRVLPAKACAGEALEPGLELGIMRRGIGLKVKMRPGRIASLTDQPHRLAGAEYRSRDDLRVEIREVAIRPFLTVVRPQAEADSTSRVGFSPRPE